MANIFLAVKINSGQKDLFLEFLKEQNCVNSIFHINSGYSFLIEIICKDQLELVNWVDAVKLRFSLEIIPFQVLKTEEKEIFIP